jgi:hypothetical protein
MDVVGFWRRGLRSQKQKTHRRFAAMGLKIDLKLASTPDRRPAQQQGVVKQQSAVHVQSHDMEAIGRAGRKSTGISIHRSTRDSEYKFLTTNGHSAAKPQPNELPQKNAKNAKRLE